MTVRRISRVLGTLLLASLACSALAQTSASDSSSQSDTSHSMTRGNHDTMFMREAAAASLAEIQAGQIALRKASSAQVKQMAQRIIDDHTRANAQLMSIAQRKQVTLPTAPMPMQKQEAEHLDTLSGASFDQAYAQAMVQDHRKAIKLFGMESQNGSDPDLKQFASTTLPALKQHMQMAEQIAGGSGSHGH
jgi:putative membrane protein